jgi:hypothetical protein
MKMKYLPSFRMPTLMKITGRSSSITNEFISSITPVVQPTEGQVREALSILGMSEESQCSYCGAISSEWDHMRPLVLNKKPTGYISEIHNLVPSCGKCNQSKDNKEWRQWMLSDAPLSPKSKGVPDLQERIKRLEAYENWGATTRMDFESIVGQDIWAKHWQNCEQVQELMRESQKLAERINNEVAYAYRKL